MSQLAIYRKYRPATFEDLLGQEMVVKVLKGAAKSERLAHAYLLAGPRGTGKTTTARLIAKIANCEKRALDAKFREKGEPCNECGACRSIDDGSSLDVVEIDAASNRGIDEIRNLKESVRVAPTTNRYKVFIVDEAHMLTKDAWNALLKTLEEPPQYVIIVLATTEIEKVPPTIGSRTQKFFFKRASRDEIASKLKKIAAAEDIKIGSEALDLIASSAEGSFRDAESLLDQLVTFGDKTISLQEVEETIGKVGFDKLSAFAGHLLRRESGEALKSLTEIADGGFNLAAFTKDLIEYLRRVAVLKTSPEMRAAFSSELMEEHLNKIIDHAKLFEPKHLDLLKGLIAAYGQMRYSQFPIIPLEVAIAENAQ
ncbi:DNA polymerase III subunit gamma/tau [Patescibacteria group bacterium]|nr:DNA polymerase III subunit gamma/tau [Patescibacteria group bacterium]